MTTPAATSATFGGHTLELVLGDIVQQHVDAIVNAANCHLAGGGGVDGAIHRTAGPAILAETRRRYPNGCPVGSAVVTTAGNLHASHVIHAVGPRWNGGRHHEAELLASAYRKSLHLATLHDCQSIALPALSTGAYGYPVDEAGRVAIHSVAEYLRALTDDKPPQLVRFVLFSPDVLATFERALHDEILD